MPIDGRAPSLMSRPVTGRPWPICISTSGVTVNETPASAATRNSSSLNLLACTRLKSGPSRPAAASWKMPSGVLRTERHAPADMAARDHAVFARELEVGGGRLIGRKIRPADAQRHGDERIVARQPAVAQPLHFVFRVQILLRRHAVLVELGLRRAMAEHRADAGLRQSVDGAIGMVRRRIVVAPVEQRGDAAIDLVECADEIGEIDVVRREAGGEPGMHVAAVIAQRPVAGNAADAGLPGVLMRVDQTGQ